MTFSEPKLSAASAAFPTSPATHSYGGWGAWRAPVPASPLDLGAAPHHASLSHVVLRTFVMATLPPAERQGLPEGLATAERARLITAAKRPERERLLTVRAGLRLLLGQLLDAEPGAVVMDDGPCPYCGRLHGRSARCPAGRRLHFAAVARGDLVVYAVSPFPVGLGLAVTDGPDRAAWLLARKPARLAAYHEGVARGRCSRA